jgi:hypothetical protein
LSRAALDDIRAEIARWRAKPATRRGRFLMTRDQSDVACLPISLHPDRVTAAVRASRVVVVERPSAEWATRLAVATRQDLWRRLRGERGLVPMTAVRRHAEGAELVATLCWLDGATPTPRAGNVLATLMENAAVRRNRQWADRVASGQRKDD